MTRVVFWSWLNAWGNKDEAWVRGRFDLWKRTALRSVLAQSKSDWRYVLVCGRQHAAVTRGLRTEIEDSRVSLVHAGAEERAWRSRLPSSRLYVAARLDSDDLYDPSVAAELARAARRKGTWLRYVRGFAWSAAEGRLFRWRQPTSPFYAQVEEGYSFRKAMRADRPRHNSQVLAAAGGLSSDKFVVTLHGHNTSTGPTSRYMGAEITGGTRDAVVARFGLEVTS